MDRAILDDFDQELLTKRRIVLSSEINQDTSDRIRTSLLLLDTRNSEEPIELWIDCAGGETVSTLLICDMINTLNCDVIGIVNGKAHSGAAIILQACSQRKATKNSRIMIHDVRWTVPIILLDELEEEVLAAGKRDCDQILRILAKRTGKTINDIAKYCKEEDRKEGWKDDGMTAEDALEFGLIDEVI